MILFPKNSERFPKTKSKTELDEYYKNTNFDRKDRIAMLIAACITFVPAILIIAGTAFGLIWLLYGL